MEGKRVMKKSSAAAYATGGRVTEPRVIKAEQVQESDAAQTEPGGEKTEKQNAVATPKRPSKRKVTAATVRADLAYFLIKLAIVVVAVWIVFTFLFGLAIVHGQSMYPTMCDGDLAFFYRLDRSFDVGDPVTYRMDGERYFGRVVAVGGDSVEMNADGQLVVNGYVQSEQVFYATYSAAVGVNAAVTVPPGSVYILGDYRTNATDSRILGAVPVKQVDGKVLSFLRRRGI